MLNLDDSGSLVRVVTTGTADIEVHVSFVDFTISGDVFLPDGQNTLITTATTTTICATPGGPPNRRNVKSIHIRNDHASAANTVTVEMTNGVTAVALFKVTLAAGEVCLMNDAGAWFVYDINGGVKVGASAASDTVAGLVMLATVAEMEAFTDVTKAVTPGRMKNHPGVAKSILHTTGTATPVANASCTYGCTITDSGVGRLTVNFSTAFSSAAGYCVQVTVEIISTTLTAAANVMQGYMRFGGQAGASSCEVNCSDLTATTNVIRDPISWAVVTYGDQ